MTIEGDFTQKVMGDFNLEVQGTQNINVSQGVETDKPVNLLVTPQKKGAQTFASDYDVIYEGDWKYKHLTSHCLR